MSGASSHYLSPYKRRHRPHRGWRKLIVVVLTVLALLLLFNSRFSPLLEGLAFAEVEKEAERLMAAAVLGEMEVCPTNYEDIVTLSFKSDGSVSSLRTNTAKLLSLRTRLSRGIINAIKENSTIIAEIPFASLLGVNFIPSGPSLSLSLRLTRTFNAFFVSKFEEMSINQTRHSIVFCMAMDIQVLIPRGIKTIRVTRDFPIAETIIVGDVPDAYTKIQRLTDDITEGEIDDIYDFGAANH